MPVSVSVPLPPSTPPVCVKLGVDADPLKFVVPPDSVIDGTLTLGVNVTVPPVVVMLPVCVKFAVGIAKVAEPLLVRSAPALLKTEPASNTIVAPPVRYVAPAATPKVPVLDPVPAA